VVDEDLEEVGRVVDVFGPVERPFLAVSPDDGVSPALLLDRPLYAR
jgi:RNA-binding protein